MSTVNCRSDKEKITVGEHVLLTCTGHNGTAFNWSKGDLKLPENQKLIFKVFKAAAASEKDFTLDYTIYAPGEYRTGDLVLTDGTSELALAGPVVKVESVLQPSPDGKPPEGFGAIMPIGIRTPFYYYLLLTLIIAAVAVYATYRFRRGIYYRKLKEKLLQYKSPVEADTQFYRSIRTAEKAGYPLAQVEKAFRLYNLRAYQLPMFDLDNERVSKYFRRNFPEFKTTRLNLNRILAEFEELQKNPGLTDSDKAEFVKKLHRYVSTHRGVVQ